MITEVQPGKLKNLFTWTFIICDRGERERKKEGERASERKRNPLYFDFYHRVFYF